jgi:uracil-DNA glycosylase
MLWKWNIAIETMRGAITHPDTSRPFVAYGDDFLPAELPPIPAFDLPAGTPAWMRGDSGWAARTGANTAPTRRTITVQVPSGIIPAGT